MVDGEQMTILYHVDDCKLSHASSEANDKMITWLRENYESIFEDGSGKMSVSRGKVHTFLGMRLDFTIPGQVIILMFNYINELLEAFDKAEPNEKGTKSSAALDDLFKVDKDCKKLSPTKAVEFHNMTAKMLYATKRARPDTCTAVAFLTTRVREPDEDDWRKLCHNEVYPWSGFDPRFLPIFWLSLPSAELAFSTRFYVEPVLNAEASPSNVVSEQ